MKIDSIKTFVGNLPKQAVKGVNTVGRATINAKNGAKTFVSNHKPGFLNSIKVPEQAKKFGQNIKDRVKDIKLPKFANTALDFVKGHKETFVGGAVILAAVACAGTIIKTVADSINEAKTHQKKTAAHQG